MIDDKPVWCLYNQIEDVVLEGLSYGEARAVLSILKPDQKIRWYAWRQGWKNWKPVASCYELIATANRSARGASPPPIPKNLRPKTVEEPSRQEDKVVKTSVEPVDFIKRRHKRFKATLNIELICNGRSFVSRTLDVALGGVRLEDQIPEWVAGYSTIYMVNPMNGEKLEFMATLVENQKTGDKCRLEILPAADHKKLKVWLEEGGYEAISDGEAAETEVTETDTDITKVS